MYCPGMPTIASQEYGEHLKRKFAGRRMPYGGGWELTLRCNLQCEHCYAIYDTPKTLLPFDQIKRIADELVSEGTLGLFLTGGEIMTRRDFPDIYMYLKRQGFILTLFTNATHVTDEIAKMLTEYPPFLIEISIYGATEDTYEKLTRIPKSFERFTQGFERLRQTHSKFILKTVYTRTNYHEAAQMQAIADRVGVKFRWDASVTSRMTGDPTPCSMRLNPEEVMKIEADDSKRAANWLNYFRNTRHLHSPERKEIFSCGAGLHSFFISTEGKLYPCLMVREENAYDLRQGTFHEGFHHHLIGFRQRMKSKEKRCDRCEIKPLCDGCPGFSYWEHGDLEVPVDYVCDISHLRYEHFVEPHLSEEEKPRIYRTVGKPLPTYPLPVYAEERKP